MSKELTEQWRNGTLKTGDYYITTKGLGIDDVLIGFYEGELQQFDCFCNCSIKEVLAPVPSYDEYVKLVSKTYELVQKIHILNEQNTKLYNELCDEIKKNNILGKRLAIATKALKEITDLAGNNENGINDYGIVCCTQEALTKMGGGKITYGVKVIIEDRTPDQMYQIMKALQ